jgi:hypothetical protein
MVNVLAKWYTENGIKMPLIYQDGVEVSVQTITKPESFFSYPDLELAED